MRAVSRPISLGLPAVEVLPELTKLLLDRLLRLVFEIEDESASTLLNDVDMTCVPSLAVEVDSRLLGANFFDTNVFDTTAVEIAGLVVVAYDVVAFTVGFTLAMTGILGFAVWVT